MNKCALIYFVVGVSITTVSFAFFDMPNKMFQMGQQMMMPMPDKQDKCVCVCDTK